MLIFAPIAGIVLGPLAGFVSGIIGGLIGMFISPGAYPLGVIDAFLSGAFLPISWGWAAQGKSGLKWFIPWWLLSGEIIYFFVPYIWPAPAKLGPWGPFVYLGPGSGQWGTWILSRVIHVHFWGPIVHIIAIFFIEEWAKSDNRLRVIIFSLIITLGGRGSWLPVWVWPYAIIYPSPAEQIWLSAFFTSWIQFPFAIGVPTAVIAATIVAMRRAGLRKIPRTCW
jgi:hypothetical protein